MIFLFHVVVPNTFDFLRKQLRKHEKVLILFGINMLQSLDRWLWLGLELAYDIIPTVPCAVFGYDIIWYCTPICRKQLLIQRDCQRLCMEKPQMRLAKMLEKSMQCQNWMWRVSFSSFRAKIVCIFRVYLSGSLLMPSCGVWICESNKMCDFLKQGQSCRTVSGISCQCFASWWEMPT